MYCPKVGDVHTYLSTTLPPAPVSPLVCAGGLLMNIHLEGVGAATWRE
jgi:hypothetical protein